MLAPYLFKQQPKDNNLLMKSNNGLVIDEDGREGSLCGACIL